MKSNMEPKFKATYKPKYFINNKEVFTKNDLIHFGAFVYGYLSDANRPYGERRDVFDVWNELGRPAGYEKG